VLRINSSTKSHRSSPALRVRTTDAPDCHPGTAASVQIAGESEGHRNNPPGYWMGYVRPPSFRLSSAHSGAFSLSLAVQICWDPSPRPRSQQHHVPVPREECERGDGAGSLRGSDRLRSFVVDGHYELSLQEDVATADRGSAIHGTRIAYRNRPSSPVPARPGIPPLHHLLTATRYTIGTPKGEDKLRVILRGSWRFSYEG